MRRIFWALRALLYKPFLKRVGFMTYIGKPLLMINRSKISLGDKVRILPGSRMEVHGQGSITIQDNVSIGQNLHIVSGKSVVVGNDVTISSNVMITDLNHDYQEIDVHIMNQKHILKEVEIGDNSFIGTGAVILPGTKLGKQVIVGSNSVVNGVFPDYCVIAGIPAKIIKRYNKETKDWERDVN